MRRIVQEHETRVDAIGNHGLVCVAALLPGNQIIRGTVDEKGRRSIGGAVDMCPGDSRL